MRVCEHTPTTEAATVVEEAARDACELELQILHAENKTGSYGPGVGRRLDCARVHARNGCWAALNFIFRQRKIHIFFSFEKINE